MFFLVSVGQKSFVEGAFTTGAFVLGAVTSILSGYIGMKVTCAVVPSGVACGVRGMLGRVRGPKPG